MQDGNTTMVNALAKELVRVRQTAVPPLKESERQDELWEYSIERIMKQCTHSARKPKVAPGKGSTHRNNGDRGVS